MPASLLAPRHTPAAAVGVVAAHVEPGRSARPTAAVEVVVAATVPPLCWMQRRLRSVRASGARTNADRAGDTPREAAKERDEPRAVPAVPVVVVVVAVAVVVVAVLLGGEVEAMTEAARAGGEGEGRGEGGGAGERRPRLAKRKC